MILTDRSRSTTDWNCPRSRYLNYELDGKGITPSLMSQDLFMGIIWHESLAAIARSHPDVDIDAIAHSAHQRMLEYVYSTGLVEPPNNGGIPYAHEQATLVEGIIRGFYKYQWPLIIKQFPKILAVEQEMSYAFGQLMWMAKPDFVGVTDSGDVGYVEYKSTQTKKQQWIDSWDTAIQLHATTRAIEANLHTKVSYIIVQGLYKGFENYGKQTSPFCYSYRKAAVPPFQKEKVAYEYEPGLKRHPTWELEGGVKGWVEAMPDEILMEQFPRTPPIFVDDDMVDRFFRQRNIREQEIAMATGLIQIADKDSMEAILDTSFPQRFDRCKPAWGPLCEYRRICHGHVEEPLKQGFSYRDPHHAIEAEATLG